MDSQQYYDKAAEYMRLAVPLMKKYEIAMTPANYAVWYEYVAGTNLALNAAVDEKIYNKALLTDLESKELYQRFFDREVEQAAVIKIREDLKRVFDEVLKHVKTGVSSATETNKQFASSLAKLNPDMTPEQINDVIEELVKETRGIMTSGEKLTDRLTIATAELQHMRILLEESRKEAKTDTLTKLANRRAFDDIIYKLTTEADTSGVDICLVFCDLDFFKKINDKHGHLVGDQVLKVVARTLENSVKGRDLVSRFGGEEFTITLLNTSLSDSMRLAESIRIEIESKKMQRKDTRESLGEITMSFGVARYVPNEGVESFLQRADRALYMSKRNGRNMVSEAPIPIE